MTAFLRKRRAFLCLVLALALVFCSPAVSVKANAVTQQQIDELKAALAELNEQAEAQQSVIDDLTANRGRVVDRKLALDKKIELTRQQIQIISDQITIYDAMITEKEQELSIAQETEKTQSERLRARVRAMEENGNYSYISFVFEADSFSELLSRLGDVNDIMHYDQQLRDEYIAAREEVESLKRSYEEYHLAQEDLRRELDAKTLELDSMVEAAEKLIASIEDMTEGAQAEYDAIDQVRKKTEADIDALVKKLAEEEAARKRAAEEAARRAQQQQQSGGTSSGGGSGGTGSATGSSYYMWPVPSCNIITSRFGYRTSPTAGASSYHGGLDIGATRGAPIVASMEGDVILAGANGGYGNCVMINHGNGRVTLYGHMESVAVGYGQHVSQGQVIGYVGSTGISTGPHCHFEIRINGAQTDPSQYFSGLVYYC